MVSISPKQITAVEQVLRFYIPDTSISVAAVFLEAYDAFMDAAPEKKSRFKDDEPDGFAAFYAIYPRKEGRRDAANAYRAAVIRAPANIILDGAKRYRANCQGKDPQFIKHPGTWLRRDCWKDEPLELALVEAAPEFSDTTSDGWIQRLETFFGISDQPLWTWRKPWGLNPFQPGNKVPESVKRQFSAEHRNLDFKALRAEYEGQQRKEM